MTIPSGIGWLPDGIGKARIRASTERPRKKTRRIRQKLTFAARSCRKDGAPGLRLNLKEAFIFLRCCNFPNSCITANLKRLVGCYFAIRAVVAFTNFYEICVLPDDTAKPAGTVTPNPGDICVPLSSQRANATSTGFAISTIVPDNDVVIVAASSADNPQVLSDNCRGSRKSASKLSTPLPAADFH